MTGRLQPGSLQRNHTVPRYVQKLFGITDEPTQDTRPSLLIQQMHHPGAGSASFHSILPRYIPHRAAPGGLSNSQLLSGVERAYTDFGRPDVWEVARGWLRQR